MSSKTEAYKALCAEKEKAARDADKIDEHHVATRFGDGGPRWVVTLDGKRCEKDIDEAYAGRDGWVIDVTTKTRIKKFGVVRIQVSAP